MLLLRSRSRGPNRRRPSKLMMTRTNVEAWVAGREKKKLMPIAPLDAAVATVPTTCINGDRVDYRQ